MYNCAIYNHISKSVNCKRLQLQMFNDDLPTVIDLDNQWFICEVDLILQRCNFDITVLINGRNANIVPLGDALYYVILSTIDTGMRLLRRARAALQSRLNYVWEAVKQKREKPGSPSRIRNAAKLCRKKRDDKSSAGLLSGMDRKRSEKCTGAARGWRM